MIDEVDAEVVSWIQSVVGDVSVLLEPPARLADASAAVVSVYLTEIVRDPAPRDVRQTPARLGLRYLVSVSDKSVARAHALLGQLLLAAVEDESQQVVLDTLSPAYWAAFGVEPRPAFMLQRPLAPVKQREVVPIATGVLARTALLQPLLGQVLGPRDLPMAGARIEISGTGQVARADHHGRFRIMYAPVQGATTTLKVRAKGREQLVQLDPSRTDASPLLVRLQIADARGSAREQPTED